MSENADSNSSVYDTKTVTSNKSQVIELNLKELCDDDDQDMKDFYFQYKKEKNKYNKNYKYDYLIEHEIEPKEDLYKLLNINNNLIKTILLKFIFIKDQLENKRSNFFCINKLDKIKNFNNGVISINKTIFELLLELKLPLKVEEQGVLFSLNKLIYSSLNKYEGKERKSLEINFIIIQELFKQKIVIFN